MSSHPSSSPSFSGSSVVQTPQVTAGANAKSHNVRWFVGALLILSALVMLAYAALSLYIATQLVYVPQKPILRTPADLV